MNKSYYSSLNNYIKRRVSAPPKHKSIYESNERSLLWNLIYFIQIWEH